MKGHNKDILVIAHFCDYNSGGNNRFNYLTKIFNQAGMEAELVTSSFSHLRKCQRKKNNPKEYKITLIKEPGYTRNVSIKRFLSHHRMGKNVNLYLKKRKRPDVIYCAVPSLDVAAVVTRYCIRNKIPFVIDIQDLWPEAFELVFHVPFISTLLFYPMKRKADFIYKSADKIIAVSDTYAKRALKVNTKGKQAAAVYLGTEKNVFDDCKNKVPENTALHKLFSGDEVNLVYVGTLGHSYDIGSVIEAVRLIKGKCDKERKNCPVKLILCGNGPLQKQFEKQAEGLPVYFMGRLLYEEMVWVLNNSDIAVNPIMHHAAQSITNKVGDYAMAGLPVINTQECAEYRELIASCRCGFNCENGNAFEMAEKIEKLVDDTELRKQMAANSRRLGEEKFDRQNTYRQILDIVREL